MNCMKCGREVALGQVFCKDCLADMAEYPVKPGTPVLLPPPSATAPKRTAAVRKSRKPEEQITILKRLVLGLSLAVLVISLAFAITTSVLANKLAQQKDDALPGQNYSTMDNT